MGKRDSQIEHLSFWLAISQSLCLARVKENFTISKIVTGNDGQLKNGNSSQNSNCPIAHLSTMFDACVRALIFFLFDWWNIKIPYTLNFRYYTGKPVTEYGQNSVEHRIHRCCVVKTAASNNTAIFFNWGNRNNIEILCTQYMVCVFFHSVSLVFFFPLSIEKLTTKNC